jgi:uncharacterized membrane protein
VLEKMNFSLDLPWPWSLTPAEGLQLLSYGVVPSWLARAAVAVLTVFLALPAWGGRGMLTGLLNLPASLLGLQVGERPAEFDVRGAALTLVLGVAGWFLANLPLIALAAVFVVYFTLATYRASARGRGLRLAALIVIRLLALLLTCLTVARPTFAYRVENRQPSILLVALDLSQSMTIRDEFNNQTREEAMKKKLRDCEAVLKELESEHQITVKMFGFAGDVNDFDPAAPADGKRSDYGSLINTLYQRFGTESNLRGLAIVGDGADNGIRYIAAAEAAKFRSIQCPVNCFVAGRKDTSSQQKDLVVASLVVEPAPVYVKGKMILRATVHAFGCETAPVEARLFFDDREVPAERKFVNKEEVTEGNPAFPLTQDNELRLETTAPQVPGEIRVKLKLSALPGEVTTTNNEISTYVTVIKEGVSVLFVGPENEEKKFIRRALAADPRINLYESTRQTDAPPPPREAELFQLDRQGYDVIILSDVSAKRLMAGNPKILDQIRELVAEKRAGLMMMGGDDSFGGNPETPGSGDWKGTPMEELLPVELNVNGQIKSPVEIFPTPAGKQHYLLLLGPTPDASAEAWRKLNQARKLEGINQLGAPKPGATVLATTDENGRGAPVMVAHTYKQGRVLAFAANTTKDWTTAGLPETTEGMDLHARFWKQTVLWLAQQENSEGSVWVKPDFRRIPAGGKQAFAVGVRGKTGIDLPGGKYQVKVVAPNGVSHDVPVRRERNKDRGEFWKTDVPGEYRLEVSGTALDVDQKAVSGNASVRFLVYQDDTELMRQAADPDALEKIAAAGGGRPKVYQLDELKDFLTALKSAMLPGQRAKTVHWPEWRKSTLSPFLPALLFLFVLLLSLEWGLRRLWGMA